MSNTPTIPTAFVSIPTDRPFRITFDVTPVYEIIPIGLHGVEAMLRRTGPHRYDISISVEEREEGSHA